MKSSLLDCCGSERAARPPTQLQPDHLRNCSDHLCSCSQTTYAAAVTTYTAAASPPTQLQPAHLRSCGDHLCSCSEHLCSCSEHLRSCSSFLHTSLVRSRHPQSYVRGAVTEARVPHPSCLLRYEAVLTVPDLLNSLMVRWENS